LGYLQLREVLMETIINIVRIRLIFWVLSPVLLLLSTALAEGHEVRTTRLTERKYDAIPERDTVLFAGSWKNYICQPGDAPVATTTMSFEPNEIGQDYSAAQILAMAEARKLGADLVFFVSGTRHKDTGEIASRTYRCLRSGKYCRLEVLEQKTQLRQQMWDELKDTEFGLRYHEFLSSTNLRARISARLGVTERKVALANGEKTTDYVEQKTGRRMPCSEYKRRFQNCAVDAWFKFFKENIRTYRSGYFRIQEIKSKYHAFMIGMPLPILGPQAEIDFDVMREQIANSLFPQSATS